MIFCLIFCVLAVCGEDIDSDDSTVLNEAEQPSADVVADEVPDISSDTETVNKSDSECCSFLIQENGEMVYGYRQDSPLNGFGVQAVSQNWYGMNILKQEIDNTNSYFFHGIITEN